MGTGFCEEEEAVKMTLNGVEFDFAPVLPLKTGDWRKLQRQGVDITNVASGGVESMAVIAQYVLKKANPDIADDFVDGLSLNEASSVAKAVSDAEQEVKVDRPT